jgi:hypothetical protein
MLDWVLALNKSLAIFPINNIADWVSLLALLLTVIGFFFTLLGVFQSKSAAVAAKASAEEAVQALRMAQSIATLQEICSKSRETIRVLGEHNLQKASDAAFDLRESVAKFQLPNASNTEVESWAEVLTRIGSVHERLMSASLSKRQDKKEHEAIMLEMGRLHSTLSAFAARRTLTGGINAHP